MLAVSDAVRWFAGEGRYGGADGPVPNCMRLASAAPAAMNICGEVCDRLLGCPVATMVKVST